MVNRVHHIRPSQKVSFQPRKTAVCMYQVTADANHAWFLERRLVGLGRLLAHAGQRKECCAPVTVLLEVTNHVFRRRLIGRDDILDAAA